MVIPFSNTKLRVPTGFQSLLVGLSTEVLRSQPKNIHAFAADYFEKLLKRRGEENLDPTEKQAKLEDRYYNNQSFQEEFPVNDPEINSAATKIQASFRGRQTRKDIERKKAEKNVLQDDGGDFNFVTISSREPEKSQREYPRDDGGDFDFVTVSPPKPKYDPPPTPPMLRTESDVQELELTETEKEQMARAEISTDVLFRGSNKSGGKSGSTSDRKPILISDETFPGLEDHRPPSITSPIGSQRFDDDHVDHLGGERADSTEMVRKSSRLSDDFERHTEIPRDSDFGNEQQYQNENQDENQDDLNDPSMEKAATKIQASFRGYKARKELATGGQTFDDQTQEPVPNEQIETPADENDEETEAAAVRIQAAYRGYRTRRELDKPETD